MTTCHTYLHKINPQHARYRYMPVVWLIISLLGLAACKEKAPQEIAQGNYKHVYNIPTPDGYTRDTADSNSFAYYLRHLELKENKTVLLYNGKEKSNQTAQYAVIKMDVGNRDLQQCADAVIRLRAEYLFAQKKYDDIHFNFTNGERADYTRYAEGQRAVLMNNEVKWAKTAEKDYSYTNFRKYLDMVFTYAGTLSLNDELWRITPNEIEAGDVFIQTGQPYGHAIIVVDVATDKKTGRKAFMLAQSFMPAQEIHILKNPAKQNDPWYYNNFGYDLHTPEWTFNNTDLKRFP